MNLRGRRICLKCDRRITVKALLEAPVLHVVEDQEPEASSTVRTAASSVAGDESVGQGRRGGAGPGVVALGEAAEPDDVAVVEARQQLQLQVEGGLPVPAAPLLPVVAPGADAPDGGDKAPGEARPVRRAAAAAGPAGLEHRGEALGGRLDLPGREPPHERQGA
jgi:hypothetical protein